MTYLQTQARREQTTLISVQLCGGWLVLWCACRFHRQTHSQYFFTTLSITWRAINHIIPLDDAKVHRGLLCGLWSFRAFFVAYKYFAFNNCDGEGFRIEEQLSVAKGYHFRLKSYTIKNFKGQAALLCPTNWARFLVPITVGIRKYIQSTAGFCRKCEIFIGTKSLRYDFSVDDSFLFHCFLR